MKLHIPTFAALALAACSPAGQPAANEPDPGAAARPSEQESLAYIDKQDRAWAEDALKNDPALLETILAEDYSGVAGDGIVRNKAQEVRFWAALPPVAGAQPPKMTYRSYGDTVLAQGDQVLTPKGGPPVRILWTDVWMFRDGKWQVAGSQNAVVPPKG
jgi:hypothetical protein